MSMMEVCSLSLRSLDMVVYYYYYTFENRDKLKYM